MCLFRRGAEAAGRREATGHLRDENRTREYNILQEQLRIKRERAEAAELKQAKELLEISHEAAEIAAAALAQEVAARRATAL